MYYHTADVLSLLSRLYLVCLRKCLVTLTLTLTRSLSGNEKSLLWSFVVMLLTCHRCLIDRVYKRQFSVMLVRASMLRLRRLVNDRPKRTIKLVYVSKIVVYLIVRCCYNIDFITFKLSSYLNTIFTSGLYSQTSIPAAPLS